MALGARCPDVDGLCSCAGDPAFPSGLESLSCDAGPGITASVYELAHMLKFYTWLNLKFTDSSSATISIAHFKKNFFECLIFIDPLLTSPGDYTSQRALIYFFPDA